MKVLAGASHVRQLPRLISARHGPQFRISLQLSYCKGPRFPTVSAQTTSAMQKIKDVAHKLGVGHTGDTAHASDPYKNVGGTYGAEGASGIAAPVDPGTATTQSDMAATGRHHNRGAETTTTTTTTTGLVGSGVEEGVARSTGREDVCGAEYFTKTEDRPVVKERVELVQEHHPVEKEFVVETRATGGERSMGTGEVEHLGTQERVVGAGGAQPYRE